jgi:hypothetical protein
MMLEQVPAWLPSVTQTVLSFNPSPAAVGANPEHADLLGILSLEGISRGFEETDASHG